MEQNKPWLENKKWHSPKITSGAKRGHYILWGFAIFWNLLTIPMFLDHAEIRANMENDPMVMLVFLFPLAGASLLVAAFRATYQWRKFGPTPLMLDPFPGSVGGHVGGFIDTNIPFNSTMECSVVLSCIHSYMSGSGKSRSRRESVIWQSSGVCHFESIAKGTRFTFRFNVPDNLPESDVKQANSYHLWRASFETELDGADFSRHFEIPVFATTEHSQGIARGTEEHHATLEKASAGIESVADIRPISGGVEVSFPAFQRPGQGIIMSVFGLIFASIGIGVSFSEAPFIFSLVFTVVGAFILLCGIFYLGKSLLISVTPKEIRYKRSLLGLPFASKKMSSEEFHRFEIVQGSTMSSGNKTIVYYRLFAQSKSQQKFIVAERLASRAEAEIFKVCFEAYLPSA